MNEIFCTQLGHQLFQVDQICTYKECNISRWCCSECISDSIHRHQMPNQDHIMSKSKLSTKVKSEIEKLQKDNSSNNQASQIKNLLSQLLKAFQKLEKSINEFIKNVESYMSSLISQDNNNIQLQSLIDQLDSPNYVQLQNDDIIQLLNIDYYQINYDIEQSLDQIKQALNTLQQNIKDYQENKLISRKYVINKIYKEEEYSIKASIITKNQKYLLYSNINVLHIYDIKQKKNCKQIKTKYILSTVQFTDDSQYLFVGDVEGYCYGLFVQNDFKNFFNKKIHQDRINLMIIQKYYIITCSDDFMISKTDFLNKLEIFKLVGHTDFIFFIDYDDSKDIIISVQDDQPLKIWDCVKQSVLFEQELSEDLQMAQLQLINNKSNLLSLDCNGNLQNWKIDYQNKQLIKLESYQGNNKIKKFSVFNNEQNLLLFCDLNCKILNNQKEVIYTIQHNIQLEHYTFSTSYRQQLDSLNYIILQDGRQIYLLQC